MLITITDQQIKEASIVIIESLQDWDKTAYLPDLQQAIEAYLQEQVEAIINDPLSLVQGNHFVRGLECPTYDYCLQCSDPSAVIDADSRRCPQCGEAA
jgi:hypothetical protein